MHNPSLTSAVPPRSTRLAWILAVAVVGGCLAVLLLWFAVKMRHAARQRVIVAALAELGCDALYDYEVDVLVRDGRPPTWIDAFLGVDFNRNVKRVDLAADKAPSALELLQCLPELETVWVFPDNTEDEEADGARLRRAIDFLQDSLPGVLVEEGVPNLMEISVIPIVG